MKSSPTVLARRSACPGLAMFAAFSIAGVCLAQTTGSTALEEIVVTAQKRVESLQDVPISVSVFTGESVRSRGIVRMDSLAPSVPNFHFSEAVSSSDNMWMRGIGSGINLGFEQSVGQVIDGFFYGRSRFGRAAFLDLERIEILKGPQGALLGKNTSSGAINITTAKPTDEFEGWITGTYEFEADDGFSVEGALSGPLTDNLKARLAVRYDDRDGWVDNIGTGQEDQMVEDVTVRGTVQWDASSNLDVMLQYQYGNFDRVGRTRQLSHCRPALLAFIAANNIEEDCNADLTRNVVRLLNGVQEPTQFKTEFNMVNLTVDWDLAGHTITSLTGYMGYDFIDNFATDLLPVELANIDDGDDWEQVTQELRFTSHNGGQFEYMAGLFYMQSEQSSFLDVHFASLPPPIRATRVIATEQDGDTAAVFGQLTWNFSEQWAATVSGRYTHEEKEASQVQFPALLYTRTRTFVPAGPAAPVHDVTQKRTENDFSPAFNLRFHPNEDMMFYGSIARGFKGGGFDHQLSANQAEAELGFQFEDEQVTAFEIGAKLIFADGAAQANVAIFRSEFDNLQVSSVGDQVTFDVGNAASAITQGIEADLRWRPTENLTIIAAMSHLDASYDEYPDAPCFAYQTQTEGCIDPDGPGPLSSAQDLSNRTLQYAPDWAVTASADYVWHLPNGLQLVGFLQAYYTDRIALALDLDPYTFQSSYVKVDARLALSNVEKTWELALVGRNLTDKLTSSFANDYALFNNGGHFRIVEAPRAIALQTTFRF